MTASKKKEGPKRRKKKRWTHVKKKNPLKANSKSVAQVTEIKTTKPPKFSWVVEGLLAGHGRPTSPGHLEYLIKNGINVLITLTENKPTVLDRHPVPQLEWVHVPVKDEKPPQQEQVKKFIATVEDCKQKKKIASVHCAWGRGRTGTMVACFLAKSKSLSAEEAIAEVRRLRPGSIDTPEQEDVVKKYQKSLRK